jgi:ribosome-binding ATPase YchF (GTP1/OBG family)
VIKMLQIAVTGKPNVGKSSFFNSATSSQVEMANYPFTTIDANKAIAHVVSPCPCEELEIVCNPRNSKCIEGNRLIPVELIDVAGLVPGAHEGKGLGNKFLDDLRQAKVFIHVIDASGSTDEEGRPADPGSHDPLEDIEFLEYEIVMWMYGILNKNWDRLIRKIEAEKLDVSKVIYEQLSGTGITLENIVDAKRTIEKDHAKWTDEDRIQLVKNLLKIAKPMLIIANKADLPTSEENINRIKEKYPNVIPTSAESELALARADGAGLISYASGEDDFEIKNKDDLNENQLKALTYIKENVLKKYGSTGVQQALNTAIFDLLNMIVVYPVEDEHKFTDQKGNILPDAILVPNGAIPRGLAYLIHTDIGEKFMHAVDARKNMRVASDYLLCNGDIISIITS